MVWVLLCNDNDQRKAQFHFCVGLLVENFEIKQSFPKVRLSVLFVIGEIITWKIAGLTGPRVESRKLVSVERSPVDVGKTERVGVYEILDPSGNSRRVEEASYTTRLHRWIDAELQHHST